MQKIVSLRIFTFDNFRIKVVEQSNGFCFEFFVENAVVYWVLLVLIYSIDIKETFSWLIWMPG